MNSSFRIRFGGRRLRRSALSLGLIAALAPACVLADEAGADSADATALDAVVVQGVRADASSSSATRLDLSIRETPQSISVIPRAQIDDFALSNVRDVLNLATGVTVEAVETDRSYYTARGFDISNFQRDGLGLGFPYGTQDGDLDTALYERVEVLRGANGLLSSTGNPSATVNFVRKRPTDAFQGSVQLSVGSWDTYRLDVDVSSPLNSSGSLRGRAVAAYENGDSYLDRYSREKQLFYGVVEANLGEATTLTAGASLQKNRPNSPMWGALPLYYGDGSQTDYDRSTSTAADWAYWDIDDTRAFVDLQHDFGNGWTLTAAYNRVEIEGASELFYVYGTPDRDTGLGSYSYPSAYSNDYAADTVDVYASGPLSLGGRTHDVVVGASWGQYDNHELSWYSADIGTPLPDIGSWDGRYPKPAFDAYSQGADFDYERNSVYATVRWNLADSVKLITGLNHTQVETRGESYGVANNYDESDTLPFAGAVWDLDDTYSLYASYGEIFNPQTDTDADGRLLGPITGKNSELGAKGAWFDGALNGSLAVFQVEQNNLAVSYFDPAAGRFVNRGEDAQSRGYELELAGRFGKHWTLSGGYTQLFHLKDPNGNTARPYVPRRTLRAMATYAVPAVPGLKLGANLRWQSDIYRIADGVSDSGEAIVVRQDDYALLGLMARYDFAERWNVGLNLDNVTDEKYISSLYWDQGYYGEPRSVSLTLGYRF